MMAQILLNILIERYAMLPGEGPSLGMCMVITRYRLITHTCSLFWSHNTIHLLLTLRFGKLILEGSFLELKIRTLHLVCR